MVNRKPFAVEGKEDVHHFRWDLEVFLGIFFLPEHG
jgi:hypothetical protein